MVPVVPVVAGAFLSGLITGVCKIRKADGVAACHHLIRQVPPVTRRTFADPSVKAICKSGEGPELPEAVPFFGATVSTRAALSGPESA